MDHKSVAQRVLKDVAGVDNIVAAAHCATRLRLVLKNQDKVDQAAIDNDEDLRVASSMPASSRSLSAPVTSMRCTGT